MDRFRPHRPQAAATVCNQTLQRMVRTPDLTLDSDEINSCVLWAFPPPALNELVAKLRARFVYENQGGGKHDTAERQNAPNDQQEEWSGRTATQHKEAAAQWTQTRMPAAEL